MSTITDNDRRIQYTTAGGESSFGYDFQIDDADHVEVYRDGVLQTRGTHYSVTGVGNSNGGDIVPDGSLTIAAGEVWTIEGDTPEDRSNDYSGFTTVKPATVDADLDRMIFMAQQFRRDINRSIRIGIEDATDEEALRLPGSVARAGKNLAFDENGDIVAVDSFASGATTPGDIDASVQDNDVIRWDSNVGEFKRVAVGVQQIVGRLTGEDTKALTPEETRRLLDDPEHATDSATDAYASAANTTAPADGVTITRDFQSANTTTTPTLDGTTITTKDGSALWAGALSGVHTLQLASGGGSWLVLDPVPRIADSTQATSSNTANAVVQRDANGRSKFADPSAAQDAATKNYVDSEFATTGRFTELLYRRTNRVLNPTFDQGWHGWRVTKNTDPDLFEFPSTETGNGPYITKFQMTSINSSGLHDFVSAEHIPIDPSKDYVFGVDMYGNGSADVDLVVSPLDENLNNLGELSTTITGVSAQGARTFEVNAEGGSAPAWPSGTASCQFVIRHNAGGGAEETFHLAMAWAIPQEEIPFNYPGTAANGGNGTHEALWDGSHLFVLCTTHNELARVKADLTREAAIGVGDYPHDITELNGSLWIVNYDGQSIQEIDKSSFSVSNTYTLDGSRQGFGVTNDGSTLYAGIGNSGDGETPAIVTVDPSDGSQSVLSTDVEGGAANIPVEYLDGSVWSIHRTNSTVKRINPSTGATEATISADIGLIYGLGSGEGYVFASGQKGVVQIDPSTDAVVATYLFRLPGNTGIANVEVTSLFAFASGLVIDHQKQTSQEVMIDGGWKWSRSVGDKYEVVVGAFESPWLTAVGRS